VEECRRGDVHFNFIESGFTDARGEHPDNAIYTCCHDVLLAPPAPFALPFGRIEHVLFRRDSEVRGM
jgi:hypothetical protein